MLVSRASDAQEAEHNAALLVGPLPARLAEGDAAALVELATFVDVLKEPSATVSVTAPEHLAQELFTHKGAGTLITRGERIISHASLLTLDVPRLNALISAAFGAPLPEGYLEGLAASGRLDRIYLSEGYRGAAVVLHAPEVDAGGGVSNNNDSGSVAYLDKFAVHPSAQGDKLGEVLWRAMTQREHKLFWRSRSANRVNPWYFEQAHGCIKSAPEVGWTVFWRNLSVREAHVAVAAALAAPPTFPHRTPLDKLEEMSVPDKTGPEQQPREFSFVLFTQTTGWIQSPRPPACRLWRRIQQAATRWNRTRTRDTRVMAKCTWKHCCPRRCRVMRRCRLWRLPGSCRVSRIWCGHT